MTKDERRYVRGKQDAAEQPDFIRRGKQPGPITTAIYGIVFFIIVTAAILEMDTLGGVQNVLLVVGCVFVFVTALVEITMEQLRDTLFSGEFENALFAGAAGTGVKFVFIVKRTRQVIYCNPGFREFFGLDMRAGARGADSMLEEMGLDRQARERALVPLITHEKVEDTVSVKTFDGKRQVVKLVVEPIARPRGYFVVRGMLPHSDALAAPNIPANDITRSLEHLFAEAPCGVYKTSADGLLLFVNPPLERMLGYAPGEMLLHSGKFKDMLFGEGFRETNFHQRWEGGIAFKSRSGNPVRVQLRQLILPNEQGKDYLHLGFVTTNGVAENANGGGKGAGSSGTGSPAQLEAAWQQFLEHSPVGVALMDDAFRVSESNASFRRMAGKREDERHGWPLAEAIAPDQCQEIAARLATGGSAAPLEVRLAQNENATGTLYIHPVQGQGGDTAWVAYLVETSAQKELERRFVHSQKMQAVGQLAGGIAHDFNNLLTAMVGFCDLLLLRHQPGEQSFADIMQIKQNANRAANLVRQLLAFSRRQTLQPEVVDITDTLAELSNLLRRLIGENITLQLQHGHDLWPVKVDQGQLEQVIINLAVNARDAMKRGDGNSSGTLILRTRNVTAGRDFSLPRDVIPAQQDDRIAPGDYVCIEVEDTGCGMPHTILTKVFEPFFTTKSVGEGTGLGLSTVCGIIQQTGGYVFVQSTVGKGTVFSIYLKRHEPSAAEAAPATAAKAVVQDLTGAGVVLLVEDEDPVRMFSSRALQNKGYTVLEADSGEEALRIVEERGSAPDIVVTDVMMPGMTGPALAKELEKRYPNIRVIFISGYGEGAFMDSFGVDRAFHFLPKPFTLSQLAGKVKEVLAG